MNQIDRWLAENYGSRRGFMRNYWHQICYLAGNYRSYRQVDWGSVRRLVFVCKGNICRSAYAEAIACSLGLDSISCGVDTRNGFPADEEAIRTAAAKGIDLGQHRTTPIQLLAFVEGDLFIAMEPWQAAYISREYGEECKCSILGLWGRPVSPYIQDPYGTSSVYFNNCFDYIEKSVHEVARKIQESTQH